MEYEKARKIAAKLLSYKAYSSREIYQKLILKGIDEEIAEKTVADFLKAGILDDWEYARMYIHDAAFLGMKGMYRIRQELRAKGIAEAIIDKALDAVEVDIEKQLEEYVKLRFLDKNFSDMREIDKAKAHLVRKGYGISEINKCFRKLNIRVLRGDLD